MNPTGTQGSGEAAELERTQAVVEGLHLAVKTVLSHGLKHPLAVRTLEDLAHRVSSCGPPFSLQFIGQALFKDRNLVPLSPREWRLCRYVARLLHGLSVHEIEFEVDPTVASVLQFVQALASLEQSGGEPLARLRIDGIGWREIPGAVLGIDAEDVDQEVFTAAQLAIAVGDAEELAAMATDPWDWSLGVAVLRRLERALRMSKEATIGALELVPGGWTVGRRAAAACLHVLRVSDFLGVSRGVSRSAAHAALATACIGLGKRGGVAFEQATGAVFERMLDAPGLARYGVALHRARVCALLYLTCDSSSERIGDGALPLVRLAYDVECARCPQDAGFDLALADLLVQVAVGEIAADGPEWVRAFLGTYGMIPPGARVSLPDGTSGLVVGGSGMGPLRPRVFVGSSVVIPEGPVTLVAPLEVAGREA